MGSDDKGKGITETIAGEVKAVAVEVYKDVAKAAVSRVGKTLELVVEVTLAVPNMLLGGAKVGLDNLAASLKRKLEGVPEDRLLPAPATIAAPATLQYLLLGDGDDAAELRKMFENLLVASMDRQTATDAHPAFVSMISQLTQDEAWILKSIDRDEYPYMELNGRGGIRTLLGAGISIHQARLSVYITNLARMGLLAFHDGFADTYENAPPELATLIEREFPDEKSRRTQLRGGSLLTMHITPLGHQFLDTCVRTRGR